MFFLLGLFVQRDFVVSHFFRGALDQRNLEFIVLRELLQGLRIFVVQVRGEVSSLGADEVPQVVREKFQVGTDLLVFVLLLHLVAFHFNLHYTGNNY